LSVFGRPFVKRFPVPYAIGPLSCLSVLSVCDVGLLWPNGWMDQNEPWHGGRPQPWPYCVRWGMGTQLSQKGHSPQFLAHVRCGQTAGWINMLLGTVVGLSPCDIVLDGDPAPPPPPSEKNKGHSPQFLVHVCCGQMAGWIKIPLGTEVGFGLGHIV